MSAHLIEEWPVYRQLTSADRPGRETAIVAAARTLTRGPSRIVPVPGAHAADRLVQLPAERGDRGDVLALESVSAALDAAGLGYDTGWSEVFRPGGLRLDEARPSGTAT